MAFFVGTACSGGLGAVGDEFCFLDALLNAAVHRWAIQRWGRANPHLCHGSHRLPERLRSWASLELDPPIEP